VSAQLALSDRETPCTIQNLSEGGIFLQTSQALPLGMPVSLTLQRPGGEPIALTGRVVWGLGEKTAARKGAVPGMRIRFDQLSSESASGLKALLKQLGAPERDPNAITQPVALAELKNRVAREQPSTQPGAPAEPARPRGADETLPHRTNGPEPKVATSQPRLLVQVQGLLMQIGELQQALSERDAEVAALKLRLGEQESLLQARSVELEKAERERRAAELAVQRLTMQLAARR
jgi:Tfp pilus assembly protein PilZ